MDLTWSMEDVARSSDDDAVRRRLARRNQAWLLVLMIFFMFVALIQASNDARNVRASEIVVAAINAAFVAYSLFLTRYMREKPGAETFLWRTGAWLRRNTHAFALTFVVVEYTVALWITRDGQDWMGWAFIVPLMMLGFRMFATELVLLHGFLLGGALVMAVNTDYRGHALPVYIGLCVVNALALTVSLVASRRMQKDIAGEWQTRRTQAREQIRMRDELRYARELQLSMLPECAPPLDWVDICSVSIPATEVGGDYYDYFVEEERIALVCGDVAGHGMASGLVLSALRSGFTLLRDSLSDPAAVLERLHDLVARTSRRRMLVTVSVVLLDRVQRTATIASAGHPPVIVRRADGTIETIALYAPPLGVKLPVHDIPQRKLAAAPGDVFVLHSDGIYETRNSAGAAYGIERLHDLVARTSRRRMLVTVSVVLLDRVQRTATIASAGHPPVIVRRADGTIETIALYAPPLGVKLPVHDIPQRKLDAAPGDVFVLHSDGIYE
ncbi:MAG TPA: SpoIIE family protein phosphatase, partial [Thermoanaerobaculia bacterium]|nr:SpoIIE family protein phosphatase [Thermoanaerobaculia bacterium]